MIWNDWAEALCVSDHVLSSKLLDLVLESSLWTTLIQSIRFETWKAEVHYHKLFVWRWIVMDSSDGKLWWKVCEQASDGRCLKMSFEAWLSELPSTYSIKWWGGEFQDYEDKSIISLSMKWWSHSKACSRLTTVCTRRVTSSLSAVSMSSSASLSLPSSWSSSSSSAESESSSANWKISFFECNRWVFACTTVSDVEVKGKDSSASLHYLLPSSSSSWWSWLNGCKSQGQPASLHDHVRILGMASSPKSVVFF